ncbi:MAG: T9SS type A sorting domain-containing protein [Bacteroidales bacterium]|nr:T9SS type A sorting domain-containing protein [Bacteroidales bacterium]
MPDSLVENIKIQDQQLTGLPDDKGFWDIYKLSVDNNPYNPDNKMDKGIHELVFEPRNNEKRTCPVNRYAVVFSAEPNHIYSNLNEETIDFWSEDQAKEGREGAISVCTQAGDLYSDGDKELIICSMPSTIKVNNVVYDIPKDKDIDIDIQLTANSFKAGADTITITPDPNDTKWISQELAFSLQGYYRNIEPTYTITKCYASENKNSMITISDIEGGLGGQYIIEGVAESSGNSFTLNDLPKSFDIPLGQSSLTIKDDSDKDKDIGVEHRQKTINLNDVTYTTPEIAINDILQPSCNGYSDGSISASINVGAKFEWSINPKPKQNGDNTEENNNTPPNQKIFSDISANTYNISCKVDECFVAEKKDIVINEPSKVDFITRLTHTTCEGKGDGIITISNLSGGNAQYQKSYKWQINKETSGFNQSSKSIIPWGNSSDITGLSEGKYSVTVYQVDENQNDKCSATVDNITIDHEEPKLSYKIGSPSCADMSEPNGWAEIFVATKDDGSSKYRFQPTSYDISPDLNDSPNNKPNPKFDNLREGTYKLSASDLDGECKVETEVTLTSNSYSFDESSTTNASCNFADNGTATIVVTPKDENGIFKIDSYWLSSSIDPTKKYIPNSGETIIKNLPIGEYQVSVNHDKECTLSDIITINKNEYNIDTDHHDLTCEEISNGDVAISLSVKDPKKDNGPFQIKKHSWTVKPLNSTSESDEKTFTPTSDIPLPDENGNYKPYFKISGLSEGVYKLSVQHDEKCLQIIPVEVGTNKYTFQNSTRDISCSEAKNGEATIQIIQTGNGIYNSNNNYQWSVVYSPDKISQTSSVVLKNLSNGIHTFSISNKDNKCILSSQVEINENKYSHSVVTTNTPCAEKSFGSATIRSNITGSGIFDPIYTWSINGSKHSTGSINTISELGSGNYNVKFEWANGGCNTEINFEIKHDTLRPSFFTTHAECADKQSIGGKVEINMSPKRTYKYIWDDDTEGTESNIVENLAAGSHTVRIVDQHNCSIQESFDILNSDFSVNVKSENALCRQDATGKVIFDIKGGRGKYAIDWQGNNALSQSNITTNTFTQDNVPVGVYTINVKDETNCVSTHKVTIASGNLKVSHKETEASCSSIGNARAEIAVSGAKLPVTYKWSDNVETPDPVRNNLTNGNYVVTVVDQNNCSMPVDIKIYSKKLSTSTAIDSATCGLDPDGAADIRLFSATSPFTFTWPDGKITSESKRSGLDKGNYDVLITDANGCEVHANVAIPHKGYLQNDVPSSINLCYNGEINVDANEFDGYEWICNGWVVDNNRFLTVKSPGTYIIKANGYDDCYAVDTISVTMSPTSFSPYFRMSSASYINDTLVVMEMSQTNPDKYSWKYDTLAFDCDNSKGSERELRLIPKLSGIYSVTLSAENQDCVSDISKPVEIFATVRPDDELSPLYVERSIVKDFAISPNPTKGPITVEVNLSQISDVRLTIYDLNFGKIRKQVTLHNSDNYKLDINDILSSGAYVVILQTGNETKQIKYIVSR